jgi:hypothetical protein
MSEKIEGTIVLEGLVEGPLPPFPDAQAKLERWAQGFAGGAVRVNLQIEGGHFSAMPSNDPQRVQALTKQAGGSAGDAEIDPAQVVADSLAELLRFFPPPDRAQVFSTIRSMEYRPNLEVQTLYAVSPDGRTATRQQRVPCKTVSAEMPVDPRDMAKRGLLGFLVALVILLGSSYFVDYPGLWRRLTASVEPVKTTVHAGLFSPYLRMDVTGLDRRTGMLKIHLSRLPPYPTSEEAFDALFANPPEPMAPPATTTAPESAPATGATAAASAPAALPSASLLRRRMAVESLAKGTIRLEFRDASGHVMGRAILVVGNLQHAAAQDAEVPAPANDKQLLVPASVELLPD